MTTLHDPVVTTTPADLSVRPASTTELLDENEVRERCRSYRHAFPDAEVHYAAKAFLRRAMAHSAPRDRDTSTTHTARRARPARVLVGCGRAVGR